MYDTYPNGDGNVGISLLNALKLESSDPSKTIKEIEDFSHRAFKNKKSSEWIDLQFALFKMNLRLIEDGHGLGVRNVVADWIFRQTVEKIEREYLPKETVPTSACNKTEFLPWIKKRIYNHRVNNHPLFDLCDKDDLNEEELRFFLANYRINMQRFHLHVAAYSLIVPFPMREELYHNLYDEFGQGDFKKAHPNLFEPLMNLLGGAKESDINPETCHLLNTKINLCWFSDGFQLGIGGMGALELAIPLQQKRILAHLRRRGIKEQFVEFFVVHCELDEEHGNGWFNAGMPYVKNLSDYQNIFLGAMRMLDARAGVYDGVFQKLISQKIPEGMNVVR